MTDSPQPPTPETMSNPALPSLEDLLRHVASTSPEPWYPSVYVRETGAPRDSLDEPLQRLRLGGLVRLTDWQQGKGQGYLLTTQGVRVLTSPREMAQLHNGKVPEVAVAAVEAIHEPERKLGDWDRSEALREAIQNPQPPRVTQVLIALNVLLFVAEAALGKDNDTLRGALALNGLLLMRGEWWRLLTTCFLHAGAMHLATNMYALLILGPWAERLWGRWRFLFMYLVAGIGGSCVAMGVNPLVTVVGASGAICGILGGEAAWLALNYRFLHPEVVSRWLRNLLVNTVLLIVVSVLPGISGAGHFGGAVAGVAAAFLLNLQRYGSRRQRGLALAGLVALPALCVGSLVQVMDGDSPTWEKLRWNAEVLDLIENCRPEVDRGFTDTVKLYETQIDPLMLLRKTKRDPAKVEQARTAVAAERSELETLVERLKQKRPYRIGEIESARQQGIESLEACIELCKDADQALQAGPNWREDESTLEKQVQKVKALQQRWAARF